MDYAGNEPHHLLAAESLVSDRDVDLSDEYRERAYASWYPGELKTDGRIVDRRLVEPHGVGFALLIAPSYALGGARAVQWQMLAMLALAFVLAAALARRMVPEPWATVGVGLVGLSPPAVAASTTITPGIAAAVLLAGAALCALAIRERPRRRYVVVGALLLAGLPWLGWSFVAAGVVVAWALVVWTLRERRRFAALVAGELLAGSLVFYATVNDRFYGGITPRSAGTAVLPDPPFGYVERLPRLVGLWLDREVGLLRWAPLIGLAFFAAWLLYRSRRDQLARVAPARREAEATAGLLLAVIGAHLVIVALVTAGPLRGGGVPGRLVGRRAAGDGRVVRVGAAPRAAGGRRRAGGGDARRDGVAALAGSFGRGCVGGWRWTPTRPGGRWWSCSRTSRGCTGGRWWCAC